MTMRLPIAGTLLILGACQTPTNNSNAELEHSYQTPLSRPVPKDVPTERLVTQSADAASKLRQRAAGAMRERELRQANRFLNRALRIAPRDAKNYLALAQLRLLELQPAQAEQLVGKGLVLADNNETRAKLKAVLQEAMEQTTLGNL